MVYACFVAKMSKMAFTRFGGQFQFEKSNGGQVRQFWGRVGDFDGSFIKKVWSVDHTIIVIYINGVCYEGTLRGPRGPKNTEYLSLYNRCAT